MNSEGYDNREEGRGEADFVPGYTPELGERLRIVIREVGGLRAASALVDTKAEQIGKWRDGKARPPFFALKQLVEAAGRSLDWLARGDEPEHEVAGGVKREGPPQIPADPDLMGRVVEAVAEVHREAGIVLPEVQIGRVAFQVLSDIAAASDGPEEYAAQMTIMIGRLKRRLRDARAAPGTGKRLA